MTLQKCPCLIFRKCSKMEGHVRQTKKKKKKCSSALRCISSVLFLTSVKYAKENLKTENYCSRSFERFLVSGVKKTHMKQTLWLAGCSWVLIAPGYRPLITEGRFPSLNRNPWWIIGSWLLGGVCTLHSPFDLQISTSRTFVL